MGPTKTIERRLQSSHLLSELDVQSLCRLGTTSKTFYAFSNLEVLWKEQYASLIQPLFNVEIRIYYVTSWLFVAFWINMKAIFGSKEHGKRHLLLNGLAVLPRRWATFASTVHCRISRPSQSLTRQVSIQMPSSRPGTTLKSTHGGGLKLRTLSGGGIWALKSLSRCMRSQINPSSSKTSFQSSVPSLPFVSVEQKAARAAWTFSYWYFIC